MKLNLTEVDRLLGSGEYRKNPYPIYEYLRENDPIHWCEPWNSWMVMRYDDVEETLRNYDRFTLVGRMAKVFESRPACVREQIKPLVDKFSAGIQHSDPPDHTRIRNLIQRIFTPKFVNDKREKIEGFVDSLLDNVMEKKQMEVLADLALPLPLMVLGDLLGFTLEECQKIKKWDDAIVSCVHHVSDKTQTNETALVENARQSSQDQAIWLDEVTEQRRKHPGNDAFSLLVAGMDEGEIKNPRELLGTYLAILIGGHETTTALISSGLYQLLLNPDQLKILSNNSELIKNAIEEFLRIESPLQNVSRISVADAEFHSKWIAKGDMVLAFVGSAHRDTRQYSDPDRLDVRREKNRHLAFGSGVHFCIGAHLARLESLLVFNSLLDRFSDIQFSCSNVNWIENDMFRVLKSLPVSFEVN